MIHTDGKLPYDQERSYWLGGFENKVHTSWNWCTKDVPTEVVTNVEISHGTKSPRIHNGEDEEEGGIETYPEEPNCLVAATVDGSAAIHPMECLYTNVYLACEAPTKKPTPVILV